MSSDLLRNYAIIATFALTPVASGGTKRLPVLNHPLGIMYTIPAAPIQIDLNQSFGTERIDDQVVRFTSQFLVNGSTPVVLDFALFSDRTPATKANFLNYVNDGDYIDSFIHRSVPGFVIQGGGFRIRGGNIESVPTNPPVVNEFGISNTLGTISMAKSEGNPDSATSQWFISLGANSDNLDNQNGGFTVFGRVTKETFPNAQTFGSPVYFPTFPYSEPFNQLPLWYEHSFGNFKISELILFQPVSLVALPPGQAGESAVLTYSVLSNSNPGLATPAIISESLTITPVPAQTGTTTLTIRATDSVGNTVDDTFVVSVGSTDTYNTWASRTVFPNNQNGISHNPDGDALNNLQEYAFFGNPGASSQNQVPASGFTGTAPGAKFMTLTFPVRKFTSGLTYVVESSSQLNGTWATLWSSSSGFSHDQVVSSVSQTDRTMVTVKDTTEMGSTSHRFMRVKVVQN
jgi:cyclophilin family peptidyl-prolyl cis-trans isomerase